MLDKPQGLFRRLEKKSNISLPYKKIPVALWSEKVGVQAKLFYYRLSFKISLHISKIKEYLEDAFQADCKALFDTEVKDKTKQTWRLL